MHRACDGIPIMLNDDDEWRGTTDPGIRRRVQNRLNQRAYRRRRRQMLGTPDKIRDKATGTTASTFCISATRFLGQIHSDCPGSVLNRTNTIGGDENTQDKSRFAHTQREIHQQCLNRKHRATPATRTSSAPWFTNPAAVFAQFQELKLGRHAGRLPSNDHLLCLMQFNVMRAFGTISSIIGLSPSNLLDDDASSPFFTHAHVPQLLLPTSLAPTALQKSTPHHPWLDILPFPQMRDNLLRLESDASTDIEKRHYDADSLCHWMVGLDSSQREAGLILWGDPWNLFSWEVTADFFQEWGWTLEGCVELFRSTNYWRAKRGEKPLRWLTE